MNLYFSASLTKMTARCGDSAPIPGQILKICMENISCFISSDRRRRILPLIADVLRHQEEVNIFFKSLQPAFKTLDMMTIAIENEMDAKRYVKPDGLSKLKRVWEQKLLIQCKSLNSEKQDFVLQILECIHQDYSKANENVFEAEQALAKRVSAEIIEFYKQQLQKITSSVITAFKTSLNDQTNPELYQQQLERLKNAIKNCEDTNTKANLIPRQMNQTVASDSRTENTKNQNHPSVGKNSNTGTKYKEKKSHTNQRYQPYTKKK